MGKCCWLTPEMALSESTTSMSSVSSPLPKKKPRRRSIGHRFGSGERCRLEVLNSTSGLTSLPPMSTGGGPGSSGERMSIVDCGCASGGTPLEQESPGPQKSQRLEKSENLTFWNRPSSSPSGSQDGVKASCTLRNRSS